MWQPIISPQNNHQLQSGSSPQVPATPVGDLDGISDSCFSPSREESIWALEEWRETETHLFSLSQIIFFKSLKEEIKKYKRCGSGRVPRAQKQDRKWEDSSQTRWRWSWQGSLVVTRSVGGESLIFGSYTVEHSGGNKVMTLGKMTWRELQEHM